MEVLGLVFAEQPGGYSQAPATWIDSRPWTSDPASV